ncbi:hypothetical protein ACJJTC_010510 [Scirpophaga incertulas]
MGHSNDLRKRAQHEAVETNQSVTLHEVDDETSTEVDKSSGPNSEPPARQEVSLESNIQGSSRGPSTSNLVAFEMATKATLVPSTPEKIGPEKDDSTKDEDVVLKRDCALPTEIISLPEFIDSTTTSIVDLNELDPLQSMMDEENDSCMEKGPEPSASAIYFSPKEIKPLPTPRVPMSTRKRKIQKSEVLTSTPVKEEQKVKFTKMNTTVLKNLNKDLDKKLKTKNITKKNTKNYKVKKAQKEDTNIKYTCYFCGEDYTEINGQPIDDWIQCSSCSQWSHEKCTAYEGIGLFICDNCTD